MSKAAKKKTYKQWQKCQYLLISALILIQVTFIFFFGTTCAPHPANQSINTAQSLSSVPSPLRGKKPQRRSNTTTDEGKNIIVSKKVTTISTTKQAKDKRLKIHRPYMHTVANSILDSVRDIEKVYPINDDCSKWGGIKFFDELLSSSKELVHKATSAKSSVISMKNSAMQIFHARNVSLILDMQGEFLTKDHPQPMLTLGVDGNISLPQVGKEKSILEKMGSTKMNSDNCSSYIDYPVMLVDSNLDSW